MLPRTILLIASLPNLRRRLGRDVIALRSIRTRRTWLQVKFAAINTLPPVGKQKRYSPQVLTYIHALEGNPPADREPIDWKLVTNLPVEDLSAAVENLGWYALRWKAEVFHKVMKSGCRAEEARLETAERLAKFLALIAVVSWRIFFVTMSARAKPDAAPDSVLPFAEITALDQIDASRTRPRLQRPTLAPTCCKSPCLAAISPANMIRSRQHGRLARHDPLARLRLLHLRWIKRSSRRCG
ncbi:hypothetical protein NKH17_26820 [Mesorhizobium sp. M1334]|uniref:hypothetical protein n=1 Tax=Mesorhizobium sp. M1334 TaxID=2957084 RepID=UPI003338B537